MIIKSIFLFLFIHVELTKGVSVEEEVKNSTTFTLDWYRSSFDSSKNTVVSPISFRILLSLLYQSTIGDTEQELKNKVYFSNKEETAQSQRVSLEKLIDSPNLRVINRVYVKNGSKLNQNLIKKAGEYHSAVELKDFTKSKQTADEINAFVEEKTNGLIKDLISPDVFSEKTALLLLNTLYFDAEWAKQFDANDVSKHDFLGIDGKSYKIDFMVGSRTFSFYNNTQLKASIIELSYVKSSNAKFWIILPYQDSNINELKDKLTPSSLKDISTKLSSEFNEIWIPTFEIESEVDGVVALKKLGLNAIFDKAEIDALENESKLKVSDAKQKVKIIVNTQGTEAAAASYVTAVLYSSFVSNLPPVFIDRPFVYMILTADTNEPFFVGHYSKPN